MQSVGDFGFGKSRIIQQSFGFVDHFIQNEGFSARTQNPMDDLVQIIGRNT